MRPLDALFSQPEQRLMGALLTHPDQEFGTLELLSRMGSSRSSGSTVIQRCVESGLLKERRVGNQRRLAANPDFILYPELRRIVLKTIGLGEPLARALAPVADRLKEAFVFGSVASGKDRTDSDIDLALVGPIDLFAISPLLDAAQRELGREVHADIYSDEEWASTDDPVIRSIRSGPRIDLMEAVRAAPNCIRQPAEDWSAKRGR